MLLCVRQAELCMLSTILFCHNVTSSHLSPWSIPAFHAGWLQCPAWWWESLWPDPCWSNNWRNSQSRYPDSRWHEGLQFEMGFCGQVQPFVWVPQHEFSSLLTGTFPAPDTVGDLLSAHTIGTEECEAFKWDRLEDQAPKTQFHDKMTKKRLKTFSDVRKKPSTSNPNKVIWQADRRLIAHIVLVAESRHLKMSDVLSHPLGPLLWAQWRWDTSKNKQSCSGQGAREAGPTSGAHPWAVCYHHWLDEPVSEDEGKWPNLLSTGRLSLDSNPTWRGQKPENWCSLWCISGWFNQECREREQGLQLRIAVPEHCTRSPSLPTRPTL